MITSIKGIYGTGLVIMLLMAYWEMAGKDKCPVIDFIVISMIFLPLIGILILDK